jgi:hypothetical protein
MKKFPITVEVFDQIKKQVLDAYHQDCANRQILPRKQNLWGNDPKEPKYLTEGTEDAHIQPENPSSIREMMLCHAGIWQFLQNDPDKHLIGKKRLYDFQNLKANATTKQVDCTYFDLQLCALYLSHLTVESYIQSLESALMAVKSSSIIYWKAYYYSYKSHKIKKFTLTIDYSTTPYTVEEKGWHDEIEDDVYKKYKGIGIRQDNYLKINLTNELNNKTFTMMVVLGTEIHIKNCQYMTGTFTAVSTHHWISSSEVVLVKTNEDFKSGLSKKNKLILKRYLMLKQNNFRVRYEHLEQVRNLKDVRGQNSDYFENFVGVHRVWGFDTKGNIYQYFFHIRADYRAYFYCDIYDDENLDKQVCLLKFSESHIQRVCISTHPFNGTGILSMCMINYLDTREFITEGGFVTIGLSEKSKPITSYIVMKKEAGFEAYFDEADEENITPEGETFIQRGALSVDTLKALTADPLTLQLFDKLAAYMKKSGIKPPELD